ncbi:MAG: hypothetical protein ACYC8W_03520 [Candidatus Tyrphobacter sp.]
MVFIARRGYKPLAVLVFLASAEYVSFAFGSVTDVAWLPFMILVAAFLSSESVIVPIALGLACATKQNPWFVIPFCARSLGLHPRPRARWAQRRARAARFPRTESAVILWDRGAWPRGVLFPMLSGEIPNGKRYRTARNLERLTVSGGVALLD